MSGILLMQLAQNDPEGVARAINSTIRDISMMTIGCLVIMAFLRIFVGNKKD